MIVSHSYNHNLPQLSKPAAKCTTEYRLRHAIAPLFGGRFAPAPRSGFTLVEVLVAMAILLVGIWALAVGFPKLLGVIVLEEKRTEMAIQAQRTLDQLTRNRPDLPLAIRGDSFNTYPETIDANLLPADPDIADFTMTPPNSRDDMIEIIGERFTLAAPLAPPFVQVPPVPIHVFRQGLAEGWAEGIDPALTVVREELDDLPPSFQIDVAGNVTFDTGEADLAQISYDWVDGAAKTYHVYDELVANGQQVYAAFVPTFASIVLGTHDGIGLINFIVGHDVPPAVLAPYQVSQHPSGALLRFHQDDVGARLRVSYTLRRGPRPLGPNPEPLGPSPTCRRGLIMTEEHRIVSRPQVITLVGSHIDDTVPLPVDLDGNTLYDDTNLLAVDLNTGDIYAEGAGVEFAGEDGAGAGRVQIDADPVAVGHDVRFYYSTLDQDLVTIQIAPETFMDWNVLDAAINAPVPVPEAAELFYRSYLAWPNFYNNTYRDLLFYPCNAGHTVTVTYDYDEGGNIFTAISEMHTISTDKGYNENYSELHTITLLHPNVEEITAVTGLSLKARAWWRAPNGRVERLDISTVR